MDVTWTVQLPRAAASVSMARALLRTATVAAGIDQDVAFELGLALTEACANVIEHAGDASPGYRVVATITDDRCCIDVVDEGVGFVPSPERRGRRVHGVRGRGANGTTDGANGAKSAGADGEGAAPSGHVEASDEVIAHTGEDGRGLMLIRAMSDRMSVHNHSRRGATVHFERDLRTAEQAIAAYG